jgi:hypothetical protein
MVAIGNLELDVGAALPLEPLLCLSSEFFDDFDAVHFPGQLREDCTLIAETGADLEDGVILVQSRDATYFVADRRSRSLALPENCARRSN